MTNTNLPLAIFLMGPTASGKTNVALNLAKLLPVEIISVDSALIYRGMDIGTAKPSAIELASVPHKLIDIKDPSEAYSAADFIQDALYEMEQITARGNIPLLVGGTMLYYKALLTGLSPLPQSDPVIRAKIEAQAQLVGWSDLHAKLAEIDPIAAERIHPNDPQRISRALEVYYITETNLTELSTKPNHQLPYQVLQFGLAPTERSILHARIEARFEKMLADGFQAEVEQLRLDPKLHLNLPSMRCVGYRQMWQYLDGEYSLDEMSYRAICATRQLAKRQLTWLRGWQEPIHWLHASEKDNSKEIYNKTKTLR